MFGDGKFGRTRMEASNDVERDGWRESCVSGATEASMARTRMRTFRASAVTVVAAFAPGCDDVNVPTTCPTPVPRPGDPCTGDVVCTYAYCEFGGFPTLEAVCDGNSFELRNSSCNPPLLFDGGRDAGDASALDGALQSCPVAAPAAGTPCEGSWSCGYNYSPYCGLDMITARCVNRTIMLQSLSCNPPAPREDASYLEDAATADAATPDGATLALSTLDAG